MDPEFGARYAVLYRHHWWWRAREARIVELLEELAPSGGFGRILDVGCGDGLFFPSLRRFGEVEGIEVDAALVSAEGRAGGHIHVGPFDRSYKTDHRFGLITLLDVIEHLDDDAGALAYAAELLDPGGVLVVTVPALPVLWTEHDEYNHHRRRYTLSSFLGTTKRAGLRVGRRGYLYPWLVPLKLWVRTQEGILRRLRGPRTPTMPTVPPAALNRFFYLICRLEQRTWGRLPWPFGSSLLAVCTVSRTGVAAEPKSP